MQLFNRKKVFSVLTTCFISFTALIQLPPESKADSFCVNIKNQNQCEKLKEQYERALKPYTEDGDYLAALDQLDKLIKSNRKLAPAYFARGFIYYIEILDNSKALKDFNQVISLDPKFSDAYGWRSDYLIFELGDFTKGIQDANKSVDVDQSNPVAYMFRGYAKQEYAYELLDKNKEDKAEIIAKEAIEDFTYVIDKPFFKLSNIYKRQYAYGLLNDVHQQRGYTYVELGALYRTNNRKKNQTAFKEMYKLAINDYSYVIKNAPDRPDDNDDGFIYTSKADGYRERGNAYSWLDDFRRACKDWKNAKDLGDEDSANSYRESCIGSARF